MGHGDELVIADVLLQRCLGAVSYFKGHADSVYPRVTSLQFEFVPLSSAHRTAALATLCENLNATRTRFPGSRLTLRFAVATG